MFDPLLPCLAVLLAVLPPASAPASQAVAPFQIPPSSQPDRLVGSIDLEAPSALAFDSRNRPYMFDTREPASYGFIQTLRGGHWQRLSYLQACRRAVPDAELPKERFLHALGSLCIDDRDDLYAVVPVYVPSPEGQQRKWALLYSTDLGQTFQAQAMDGMCFLELRTGHNDLSEPPAVGMLIRRKDHPALWASYNDLYVFLPSRKDGQLILGEPIHVTSDCFGISNHSGGYSFAVSLGGKTHVVYGEIPGEGEDMNPTFAAVLDRQKHAVVSRTLLARANPRKPDVHATPVIAADSKGYLHVLCGAHVNPFLYLRSLQPNDATGWSEPQPMHKEQSYTTLLCDSADRLHSVYRIHPHLIYQHKPARGEDWSDPVTLADPPPGHTGYSVYYHRLFLDRRDAIYLSFTFYEMNTKDSGVYPRALAVSVDHGRTWRLPTTDLIEGRIGSLASPASAAAVAHAASTQPDGRAE